MRLFRKNKPTSREETKEDLRNFRIAVVGNNLFYLKKCALDLGDEEVYKELVKLEREFLEGLERRNKEDAVDTALWYLEETVDDVNYVNPKNKEKVIRGIQRIRELIESRYGKV